MISFSHLVEQQTFVVCLFLPNTKFCGQIQEGFFVTITWMGISVELMEEEQEC